MNDSIHDWTGAYAAHSLSDAEREEFERHLTECADCQAEVDSFAAVLADLADADEASLPLPAGLEAAVMAEIARTPQDVAAVSTTGAELHQDLSVGGVASVPGSTGEASNGIEPANELDTARERRAERGARGRLGLGPRMLATAAAVLAVAAVGVGVVLNIGNPESELVATVTQASDAASHDFGWEGASLVVSEESGAFALTGTAPALAEGQEYQLWIVHTSGVISPGPTFADGTFAEAVAVDLADVAAVALSIEPAGGSEQPTTTPVAALEL